MWGINVWEVCVWYVYIWISCASDFYLSVLCVESVCLSIVLWSLCVWLVCEVYIYMCVCVCECVLCACEVSVCVWGVYMYVCGLYVYVCCVWTESVAQLLCEVGLSKGKARVEAWGHRGVVESLPFTGIAITGSVLDLNFGVLGSSPTQLCNYLFNIWKQLNLFES